MSQYEPNVGVCCNVVSVLCSLEVNCWERVDLLAVVFVVLCHFPKCVLVYIRIKGEVGASVYMCFVVTCWERADLLALVCGVFCEFVTFPLVFWVGCGA